MAIVNLIMPKMGESIVEATILNWVKNVGDVVKQDETILEIATDKVDSEVPSPVDGVIKEILFAVDDVVEIGTIIAKIESDSTEVVDSPAVAEVSNEVEEKTEVKPATAVATISNASTTYTGDRFYSPLVRNMAKEEGVDLHELDKLSGTGKDGRFTKKDMLKFIADRSTSNSSQTLPSSTNTISSVSLSGTDEIIQMDRMRKLIADHMVMSKQTSPHVTSFVEADVTNIWNWRKKVKKAFQEKYGEKITFTPIFMEAVAKAIRDFPMINVSVNGDKIIKHGNINVGMATALPSGNLIVPVIKNTDLLNLAGLTKAVNDLANRARQNKLKPDEIQNGTYTLTNLGTFGNIMGTPIINQPQVAILAVGAIQKKPAVVETEFGDVIAIRYKMILSHAYDHRVVDGYLGGTFVKRVAEYLEAFDVNRPI